MKKLMYALFAVLLLAGCASPAANSDTQPIERETPAATTAETTPETTVAETTQPTIPPDPMELRLQEMTLEQKVGQLFLARHPAAGGMDDVTTYHLGGYIFFTEDFVNKSADDIYWTMIDYQAVSAVPMLFAVDEEGGTVNRVSRNPDLRETPFPSPRTLYDQGGLDAVLQVEAEKCALLQSLGLNVNMAPVCDITTDPGAFMYQRSLGQSPEVTGEYIRCTVELMSQYGIGSVLKHFPGYGNNTDTHTGIAVDYRTLDELNQVDLVPFISGIEAGCGAILVSHTIVEALDPQLPATLSPAVHDYLRNELGFQGVIVTDDLVMQAITDTYGAGEAAVLAVLAGNDLLCSTEYQVQYQAVLEAVQNGRISEAQLDQAVLRILRWKTALGLVW